MSCEQLQDALAVWVARAVADREMSAPVDGKGVKQPEDAQGNPLVMVNVMACGLKLCLAQWLAPEKRYEPWVLRERLGQLLGRYPGLRLLTMDALYAGRPVCVAGTVSGGIGCGRDCLARVEGNRPGILSALSCGFDGE